MSILCNEKYNNIISWSTDGRGFMIKKKRIFSDEILPIYFSRNLKYASFIRRLSRWGFQRIRRGPNMGLYHHPLFRKDNFELCLKMHCVQKNPKNDLSDPRFYEEEDDTQPYMIENDPTSEAIMKMYGLRNATAEERAKNFPEIVPINNEDSANPPHTNNTNTPNDAPLPMNDNDAPLPMNHNDTPVPMNHKKNAAFLDALPDEPVSSATFSPQVTTATNLSTMSTITGLPSSITPTMMVSTTNHPLIATTNNPATNTFFAGSPIPIAYQTASGAAIAASNINGETILAPQQALTVLQEQTPLVVTQQTFVLPPTHASLNSIHPTSIVKTTFVLPRPENSLLPLMNNISCNNPSPPSLLHNDTHINPFLPQVSREAATTATTASLNTSNCCTEQQQEGKQLDMITTKLISATFPRSGSNPVTNDPKN